MFPYMLETKGLGNYQTAFERAKEAINESDPRLIAQNAQVEYDEAAAVFRFGSFGLDFTVSLPTCQVCFAHTDKIPILEWRLAMLHYLSVADGAGLSPDLAHFRQMPGGNAYESAFKKRSIDILVSQICDKPLKNTEQVLAALGGKIVGGVADLQAEFMFMPKFPLLVQIWGKDEDLAGTANLLFNKSAKHYLPTEDMAVIASVLSRFVFKQYKLMFG